MSASIFRLTELPIETLEQILLHLPNQDIIKMEVVRCHYYLTRSGVGLALCDSDQSTIPGSDS